MACNIADRLVADTNRASPRRSTTGNRTFHIDSSRRQACSTPWISANNCSSVAASKASPSAR
jgi:hypothetical protein